MSDPVSHGPASVGPEAPPLKTFRRLDRDPWFDRIDVLTDGLVLVPGHAAVRVVLRLRCNYRYKTSGLSGNQWRVSWMWQANVRLLGDVQPAREAGWWNYDGPYHTIEAACAAAFPGIFTSQQQIHNYRCLHIDFFRKNRKLYEANHPTTQRVIDALGHLPWALLMAGDAGVPEGTSAWNNALCFQSGCPEPAVSVYQLKQEFCCDGHPGTPTPIVLRCFCGIHLERGDGGLEDADSNYVVLEGGRGPDQATPHEFSRAAKTVIVDVP